jgi:membrane protease YdiL (CAAX protease family)
MSVTQRFLALVFLLALPFWLLGALVDSPSWTPMGMPLSALMFVLPGVVALVLDQRILRGLRFRLSTRRWWLLLPAALLAPALLLVTELLVTPGVGFGPFGSLPLLVVMYLVAAAFEELGWTSFLTERLLQHRNELSTAVIVGVAWGLWHVVPLLQAGRDLWWIAGWFVGTVAVRVVICRLYLAAGRVAWVAVACHASINIAESLVPNIHLAVVLVVDGLLTALVAVVLTVVRRSREVPTATPA